MRVGRRILASLLAIGLLAFPGPAGADERQEVVFNLGLAAFLEEDYQRAADRFREAAAADPDDANARLWLGIAEARLGNNQAAEQAFEEALAIDPDYPDAVLGRGIVRARLGKSDAARDDWARAAEIGAGTPVRISRRRSS